MRSSFDRTYPTTKCLQLSQDSASFGALDAFFLCAVARKGDKEHGTIEVKICRSVDQKSLLFRVLVDHVVAYDIVHEHAAPSCERALDQVVLEQRAEARPHRQARPLFVNPRCARY